MTGLALDEADVRARLGEFICLEIIQDPSYPLQDGQPLVTGGLIDSVGLAYLGVFIESAFGVYLADTDLTPEYMDTVNQIAVRVLGS